MIYMDTSVLIPLFVLEPKSSVINKWFTNCADQLVSASWCVTEFASALGIKQRTAQISNEQSVLAWQAFERFCSADLHLLTVEPSIFHQAALLTLDPEYGLRAGDALHLAVATHIKAKRIATLDDVLAHNAKRLKIKPLAFT